MQARKLIARIDLYDISHGDNGKCNRCGQYSGYSSLSALRLCPGCQEKFDREYKFHRGGEIERVKSPTITQLIP